MAGGWLAGAGAAELRAPVLGDLSFLVAEFGAPMMEIGLLGADVVELMAGVLADFFFWAEGVPVSGSVCLIAGAGATELMAVVWGSLFFWADEFGAPVLGLVLLGAEGAAVVSGDLSGVSAMAL